MICLDDAQWATGEQDGDTKTQIEACWRAEVQQILTVKKLRILKKDCEKMVSSDTTALDATK